MKGMSKYQIKIRSKEEIGWTHLAYVPTELKQRFNKATEYKGWTNNDWLDKWAQEDFGFRRIEFWEELYELRKKIRAKYRELYPELHIEIDTDVDTKGWIKLWVISKLKEELKHYE